jgi:hypothetical protein
MRGSGLVAVVRLVRPLVGGLFLVLAATSCAPASPMGRDIAGVLPTFNPLDPCAGAQARMDNTGTTEAVALRNFLLWSQFPARNARARTIIDDGSFARVVVCAEVRHGLSDTWDPFSGEYALALTHGQWTVQDSPLDRLDGFVSVRVTATQQARDGLASAQAQEALSARAAIQARVIGITPVLDTLTSYTYSSVTLELRSTDDKQHTVVFWPEFTAKMRQCSLDQLEGREAASHSTGSSPSGQTK